MATKQVPEGYQTVTLYLAVDDAVEAMNGFPVQKGLDSSLAKGGRRAT